MSTSSSLGGELGGVANSSKWKLKITASIVYLVTNTTDHHHHLHQLEVADYPWETHCRYRSENYPNQVSPRRQPLDFLYKTEVCMDSKSTNDCQPQIYLKWNILS